MKYTKRLLSALLASLLVATNFAPLPASASESTEGYYTYEVIDGEATITDCDSTISGDITIPSTLGGYPVTAIGYDAFNGCASLTDITIPDGVRRIGSRAFYNCTGLTEITFDGGVEIVEREAFKNCVSLKHIALPDSVKVIELEAFYGCENLESIDLGNSLTTIGMEAFRYCYSLKSIALPAGITSIGQAAFLCCESLEAVYITDLEAWCKIDFGSSVLSCEGEPFLYLNGELLEHLEIPEGITEVKENAFSHCRSLRDITIAEGVGSIGYRAFYGNPDLTTVTIPASVTQIGESSFGACGYLTDVYFGGTKQQWEAISVGEWNEDLLEAKIHYKGEFSKLEKPELEVDGHELSWNSVAFADSYEIYRATSKSGKYTKVTTVAETSWADNVTPGKTYYYKVKAIYTADSSKNSDFSNCVSIDYKLASPVISVENNDSGKPCIAWEKVSGAKKYTIYVATSQNGSYKKLGTSTKTYYTDTKAKAGATYFYKVVANASSSKYSSGYSNTVSCGVICGTPTVSVTVDANTGKPSLSWKKVDGASQYAIYRKLPTDAEFVLLAQQTAVSYKDTTAPVDTKCEYYVQALGKTEALNGAVSKVVTAASGIAKPTVTGSLNDLGQPKLSWNAVEGAVKYELYRSTKSSSGYVLLGTVEDRTYEDTTATIGKTYYYKLKAIGTVSKSADSSYVKLAGKCTAPVISVENNDSGKPCITWEKVSGAKKYTVYVATSQNGSYKKLGTSTKTYYTDTKAKAGTTYFYKVIANASSSKYNSGYSNIASCGVICGMPAVTVTVDANTGKPALSWKKVDGATQYAIYRKLPGGEFTLLITQTAVSYKDTTAPVDTKCEYYVQALGKTAALNGAASKVVTATSGIAKPTVTGNLNDLGQPKLSWKQVEGAVKYEVYRSTKSGSGYVLIQTVEGLTCEDTTATIGKTYYYKVKAIGTVSKSADSDYVKLVGKCATPVISVENNASGKLMISWAQVSGAKKYTVYRATAEDGKYTKLGTTTKLTYTDTTAKAGNTYFYKVVANASSSKYDSGYSNIVSATYRLISSSTDKDTGSNAIWEDPTNTRDYYEETDPNRAGYLAYIATYNNTLFFYLQEDSMRMYLGKTYGMPLIASQETMLACTWFSSDSSVATVNNLGFVTPLKLGTTVISVCYTDPETGEQSVRRCDVRIESKPVYTIAQLEAAAKEEAQKIANYAMYEAGCTTDLERIAVAAALINAYVANGKGGTYYAIVDGQLVEKKIPGYNQPYGTLVTFHSTCAGDVRALGMVLEYMGFQWYHINADKNTHQWCVVYDVDGQTAFADGAQYGVVGYGDRAEDQSNWMIYRNGILQPFR